MASDLKRPREHEHQILDTATLWAILAALMLLLIAAYGRMADFVDAEARAAYLATGINPPN